MVNTSVCGTDTRGFDSRRSPHFFIIMKFISRSEKETIKIGEEIAKNGRLFIIKGPVGSGKTRIVKGIASHLGIKDEITSPTFGFKKNYEGLVHYDLYLANSKIGKEFIALINEELEDNYIAIEWGEKIPLKILNDYSLVTININNDDEREIILEVK